MKIFILIFSFFPFLSLASEPRVISLAIGEQKSFPLNAGSRYSVGNPEVIQVKLTHTSAGALLLVKGKSQGYSDLLLIEDSAPQKNLSFKVISKRQMAIAQGSNLNFSPNSGLRVQSNGDGWLIRGEAKSLMDWNIAQALQDQSKGKVQKLAKLHPMERLKAEDQIRKRFRLAGLTHLKVKGAGSHILLSGDAINLAEKEYAEELAREIFIRARSHIRVPFEGAGRLRYRAKIIEILRSGGEQLGMDWNQSIDNALQISTHFTKAQFSLAAGLKFLEKNGKAKTLSQPELLLNEKGIAELKVGGEIPITVKTKNQILVQWKPYGLRLRLELPGMSEHKARTNIVVELSSLDHANALEGIPGIRLSHMETQVDMAIGRPILLSGLTESMDSRDVSSLPGLSSIPILGELFKSSNYQEKKSELVILLEASK